MTGTKDIKDFTKYPSLSDNDCLIGTKSDLGGTDAGIKVSDFKKLVGQDVKPEIKNGYWWVSGVNTGQLAIGRTPEFRFTTLGLEMKYEDEDDTAYLVIIPIEDLLFTFDDLTPEQVELLKLKFSDLTDAEKEALRGAAFTFDMFTPEQLADLRLTWEKLTSDQKNEIKGERGYSAFEVWTQQEGNADKTVDDYLAWLCQPATDAASEVRDQMVQISQEVSQALTASGNATKAAVEVTGDANAAASLANEKAELALTAAGKADDSTTAAVKATQLAIEAEKAATQAAGLAIDAATLADKKADLANTAAGTATVAAERAEGKAGLADTAANRANAAAAGAENIVKGFQSDWNVTDPTDPSYIQNKPEIPTLGTPPGTDTISYVNSIGTTVSFRIGDEVRVLEDGEYVFYRLYDLVDDIASWQESGSGTALLGNIYLQGANYYNNSIIRIKEGFINE